MHAIIVDQFAICTFVPRMQEGLRILRVIRLSRCRDFYCRAPLAYLLWPYENIYNECANSHQYALRSLIRCDASSLTINTNWPPCGQIGSDD